MRDTGGAVWFVLATVGLGILGLATNVYQLRSHVELSYTEPVGRASKIVLSKWNLIETLCSSASTCSEVLPTPVSGDDN